MKFTKMVYYTKKKAVETDRMLDKVGAKIKKQKVAASKRNYKKLQTKQIITLAKIAVKLEKHYYFPQDMEWL